MIFLKFLVTQPPQTQEPTSLGVAANCREGEMMKIYLYFYNS